MPVDPSIIDLRAAGTEPWPFVTGAVRGLSTERSASSRSDLTMRRACEAEKMPLPAWLSGGGEVAVGDRRRWMESRERCVVEGLLAPPLTEEERLSFMAERSFCASSLEPGKDFSTSEPEVEDAASFSTSEPEAVGSVARGLEVGL